MQVSNATFELDGVPGTGGGTLSFAVPTAAAVHVEMDRFDLDAYAQAGDIPNVAPSTLAATPAVTAAHPVATPPPTTAPSFGPKAKVAKLVYRGETLNGVEGDATVQGNLLKLTDLKVANLPSCRAARLGERFRLRAALRPDSPPPSRTPTGCSTTPSCPNS